jgi:hypothetical protein
MQAFLLLNQTWGHIRILSLKSEYCLVMMEETQVIFLFYLQKVRIIVRFRIFECIFSGLVLVERTTDVWIQCPADIVLVYA